MSDTGSFQITASPRVLECVRSCVHSLKMEPLFPMALWLSQESWPSEQTSLGVHLPSAGSIGWGACLGCGPLYSLGRTSAIVIILLFVGYIAQGVGLDYTAS